MKKITIITTHLSYGGIQQYLSSLCKMLENDYKITIVSIFKKEDEPAFTFGKNIKIHYLYNSCSTKKEWRSALKHLNILEFIKESKSNIKAIFSKYLSLSKYLKKIDTDIIITTRLFDTKKVNKILKNKKIIKIMTEHNTPDKNMKKRVLKATNNFDYVVFNSKEIYDIYKNELKDKAKLINPVVDFNGISKSKLNTNNLIAIGRFEKEKGFVDIVEVIKLVKNKIKDVHLNLIGDGTLWENINSLIKENALENYITCTGFLDKKNISKYLKESSLYLMTSHSESLGLVMLESLKANVPVIAFDSSLGARTILKEGNGILIKKRNKKEMAKIIIDLLSHKEKIKELINNKSILKEYEFDNVKSIWLDFLNNAKSKKKIMFIANSGGHLTELLQLKKLIKENNSILITEKVESTLKLTEEYNVFYFNYGTRSHMFSFVFKFLGNCFKSLYILFKFRPKFIITTGTHIAGPMCILAHLTKTKVIYIETMANVKTKSATGKLAYPFTNLFIVQWKDLLDIYPKNEKTVYFGRIV